MKISNLVNLYSNKKSREFKNKRNNIIFNCIKYKNLGGIKLEVKGRLTKRYRADRSVYKFYLKGALNIVDSSLSSSSSSSELLSSDDENILSRSDFIPQH